MGASLTTKAYTQCEAMIPRTTNKRGFSYVYQHSLVRCMRIPASIFNLESFAFHAEGAQKESVVMYEFMLARFVKFASLATQHFSQTHCYVEMALARPTGSEQVCEAPVAEYRFFVDISVSARRAVLVDLLRNVCAAILGCSMDVVEEESAMEPTEPMETENNDECITSHLESSDNEDADETAQVDQQVTEDTEPVPETDANATRENHETHVDGDLSNIMSLMQEDHLTRDACERKHVAASALMSSPQRVRLLCQRLIECIDTCASSGCELIEAWHRTDHFNIVEDDESSADHEEVPAQDAPMSSACRECFTADACKYTRAILRVLSDLLWQRCWVIEAVAEQPKAKKRGSKRAKAASAANEEQDAEQQSTQQTLAPLAFDSKALTMLDRCISQRWLGFDFRSHDYGDRDRHLSNLELLSPLGPLSASRLFGLPCMFTHVMQPPERIDAVSSLYEAEKRCEVAQDMLNNALQNSRMSMEGRLAHIHMSMNVHKWKHSIVNEQASDMTQYGIKYTHVDEDNSSAVMTRLLFPSVSQVIVLFHHELDVANLPHTRRFERMLREKRNKELQNVKRVDTERQQSGHIAATFEESQKIMEQQLQSATATGTLDVSCLHALRCLTKHHDINLKLIKGSSSNVRDTDVYENEVVDFKLSEAMLSLVSQSGVSQGARVHIPTLRYDVVNENSRAVSTRVATTVSRLMIPVADVHVVQRNQLDATSMLMSERARCATQTFAAYSCISMTNTTGDDASVSQAEVKTADYIKRTCMLHVHPKARGKTAVHVNPDGSNALRPVVFDGIHTERCRPYYYNAQSGEAKAMQQHCFPPFNHVDRALPRMLRRAYLALDQLYLVNAAHSEYPMIRLAFLNSMPQAMSNVVSASKGSEEHNVSPERRANLMLIVSGSPSAGKTYMIHLIMGMMIPGTTTEFNANRQTQSGFFDAAKSNKSGEIYVSQETVFALLRYQQGKNNQQQDPMLDNWKTSVEGLPLVAIMNETVIDPATGQNVFVKTTRRFETSCMLCCVTNIVDPDRFDSAVMSRSLWINFGEQIRCKHAMARDATAVSIAGSSANEMKQSYNTLMQDEQAFIFIIDRLVLCNAMTPMDTFVLDRLWKRMTKVARQLVPTIDLSHRKMDMIRNLCVVQRMSVLFQMHMRDTNGALVYGHNKTYPSLAKHIPDDDTADLWQLLGEFMQPGMFLSEAEVLWVFLNYLRSEANRASGSVIDALCRLVNAKHTEAAFVGMYHGDGVRAHASKHKSSSSSVFSKKFKPPAPYAQQQQPQTPAAPRLGGVWGNWLQNNHTDTGADSAPDVVEADNILKLVDREAVCDWKYVAIEGSLTNIASLANKQMTKDTDRGVATSAIVDFLKRHDKEDVQTMCTAMEVAYKDSDVFTVAGASRLMTNKVHGISMDDVPGRTSYEQSLLCMLVDGDADFAYVKARIVNDVPDVVIHELISASEKTKDTKDSKKSKRPREEPPEEEEEHEQAQAGATQESFTAYRDKQEKLTAALSNGFAVFFSVMVECLKCNVRGRPFDAYRDVNNVLMPVVQLVQRAAFLDSHRQVLPIKITNELFAPKDGEFVIQPSVTRETLLAIDCMEEIEHDESSWNGATDIKIDWAWLSTIQGSIEDNVDAFVEAMRKMAASELTPQHAMANTPNVIVHPDDNYVQISVNLLRSSRSSNCKSGSDNASSVLSHNFYGLMQHSATVSGIQRLGLYNGPGIKTPFDAPSREADTYISNEMVTQNPNPSVVIMYDTSTMDNGVAASMGAISRCDASEAGKGVHERSVMFDSADALTLDEAAFLRHTKHERKMLDIMLKASSEANEGDRDRLNFDDKLHMALNVAARLCAHAPSRRTGADAMAFLKKHRPEISKRVHRPWIALRSNQDKKTTTLKGKAALVWPPANRTAVRANMHMYKKDLDLQQGQVTQNNVSLPPGTHVITRIYGFVCIHDGNPDLYDDPVYVRCVLFEGCLSTHNQALVRRVEGSEVGVSYEMNPSSTVLRSSPYSEYFKHVFGCQYTRIKALEAHGDEHDLWPADLDESAAPVATGTLFSAKSRRPKPILTKPPATTMKSIHVQNLVILERSLQEYEDEQEVMHRSYAANRAHVTELVIESERKWAQESTEVARGEDAFKMLFDTSALPVLQRVLSVIYSRRFLYKLDPESATECDTVQLQHAITQKYERCEPCLRLGDPRCFWVAVAWQINLKHVNVIEEYNAELHKAMAEGKRMFAHMQGSKQPSGDAIDVDEDVIMQQKEAVLYMSDDD